MEKQCDICGKLLPATKEYFYGNKSNGSDYLYPRCKVCHKGRVKGWQKDNREEHLEYKRNSWRKNKRKYLEYAKKRRLSNPSSKIASNMRSRMWHVLKGASKSKPTMELLGCSIDRLWIHLESQFVDGMTRENYGEWHVDHIIPCSFFDLTDPEQQKECFHYTNLQPLWAIDNLIKNKY